MAEVFSFEPLNPASDKLLPAPVESMGRIYA